MFKMFVLFIIVLIGVELILFLFAWAMVIAGAKADQKMINIFENEKFNLVDDTNSKQIHNRGENHERE